MVDLVYIIAKRMRMNARLYLPKDNAWGAQKTSAKGEKYWTGMIGEIIKREVNIVSPIDLIYTAEKSH